MRKIIFQMMVSIDGSFEGQNKELDWHNVDEEFNEYAINFLKHVDVLLFGRVTYELMANYWPTKQAITDDPVVAEKMNSLHKIVFSKTLKKTDWNNTRLVNDSIDEEISSLKHKKGKNIAIFGSSNLGIILVQHNLIDEYRIFVNPIVLGHGKSLFEGIDDRLKLKLIKTKIFKSGNVLLYYEPRK